MSLTVAFLVKLYQVTSEVVNIINANLYKIGPSPGRILDPICQSHVESGIGNPF
jgi:hypothetical protein